MSIFKIEFYFYILPRLYISIIFEQLTNKDQVFVRKKSKMHKLTANLNISVNQMNSDNIMDGTVGFAV